MYENLWRKTTSVLQKEVPINSISKVNQQFRSETINTLNLQQLKTDHSAEVQKLNEEIIALKALTEKASRESQVSQNHVRLLTEEAKKLFLSNKEISEKLAKVEAENKDLHEQIQEFEKCFAESNELNREQMEKSSKLFQKLQESNAVADEAMTEVERLMIEKKQMQEECDWLSTNISSIIESASQKIDKDMDEIKLQHERELEKLNQLLDLEREKVKTAETSLRSLEGKLEASKKQNSFLLKDLKTAMETIVS
jgi:chromosome segregation ATPase